MSKRKFIILIISLLCYVIILRWFALFLFIPTIMVLYINNHEKSKYMVLIGILFFILGFFVNKFLLTKDVFLWGYSVFAFSGISFLVDQYKQNRRYSTVDILLYLFFFPKMLAGPIVRADELIPQFSNKISFGCSKLYKAFKIITYALFLKFIVADNLSTIESISGINLFVSCIIWGVRFYLDFYAYSLLAVGLAIVCGIHLPYNFNDPYISNNFRDFWKRWNITLSLWLRDYVYIPLRGSRKGQLRTCFNVMIVFVVSGLWHGITIPFILWGIIHGILVCIEKAIILPKNKTFRILYKVFVTFTAMLLWTLFKMHNLEGLEVFINNIFKPCTVIDFSILQTLGISLVVLFIVQYRKFKALVFEESPQKKDVIWEVLLFTLFLGCLVLYPGSYSFDFFYFNY